MVLEYERRTHFPSRRGNVRLRVDDDGAVYFQRNDGDPPAGQDWTHELGAPVGRVVDPARRLHKLLDRGGFFKLPERIESLTSTDGTIERLTFHGQDGARTVTMDRARDPRFRELVNKLAAELGVLDRL